MLAPWELIQLYTHTLECCPVIMVEELMRFDQPTIYIIYYCTTAVIT